MAEMMEYTGRKCYCAVCRKEAGIIEPTGNPFSKCAERNNLIRGEGGSASVVSTGGPLACVQTDYCRPYTTPETIEKDIGEWFDKAEEHGRIAFIAQKRYEYLCWLKWEWEHNK